MDNFWGAVVSLLILMVIALQFLCFALENKHYSQVISNQEALYFAMIGQPLDLVHDFGTKPVRRKK